MTSLAPAIKPAIVRIEAQSPQGVSVGTGFLVSTDGHVVTCWHVVAFYSVDTNGGLQFDYSKNITANLNGKLYQANVVHRQTTDRPYTCDFAVLKIDLTGAPCLPLGDYTDVEQGDEVCFMGYPKAYAEAFFGAGNVSVLRSIPSHFNQMIRIDAIKIDASINTGNSGGPLVDFDTGKVVGIVTLRHGNITPALRELRDFFSSWPKKGGLLETTALELINLAERNINIGLGTAISITYAKDELKALGVKI